MFWKPSLKDKNLMAEMQEILGDMKKLRKDKKNLEEEVENLKLKKRLEAEEIKHLTKINEERLKQELESAKIKLQKDYQINISEFKEEQRKELVASLTQFHSKMEKRSDDEIKRLKEMYSQIMGIMPKVNLMLEKKVR